MDEVMAAMDSAAGGSRLLATADAEFLRRATGARAFRCPVCTKPVGALTQPVCPHCGETLRLDVGAGEGGISRLWIALAIALSVAAGMGVFVVLIVAHEGWPTRGRGGSLALQASLVYFMANIPLALLAIFQRQAFRRLPHVAQLALMIGGWSGTLGSFAALFYRIY